MQNDDLNSQVCWQSGCFYLLQNEVEGWVGACAESPCLSAVSLSRAFVRTVSSELQRNMFVHPVSF